MRTKEREKPRKTSKLSARKGERSRRNCASAQVLLLE